MAEKLRGANALIFEANHDLEMLWKGRYPQNTKRRIAGQFGHLSNEDAGKALTKIITKDTQYVAFGYLSEENNRPELALQTVHDILQSQNLLETLELQVAPPYHTSKLMIIK